MIALDHLNRPAQYAVTDDGEPTQLYLRKGSWWVPEFHSPLPPRLYYAMQEERSDFDQRFPPEVE